MTKQVYRRRYESRRLLKPKLHFKKQKNKIKFGEKRFSIWRMELLHPAMWHVALESWQLIHQVAAPCSVIRDYEALGWHAIEFARWEHPAMWHIALGSWHWIRQVAVPCNVAGGSGMTCHGIRPNVRHIRILLLVLISTIPPQSTCHSAPVCEILSKTLAEKIRHVDFQDGGSQPSWILGVQ